MEKFWLIGIVLTLSFGIITPGYAQEKVKSKLYDEEIDPNLQIQEALTTAQLENKHVLLQLGGNWCSWCIRFHEFVQQDDELKNFLDSNYVSLKINYSSKNRNLPLMEKFGYPQRFGFPVFVILDAEGKQLHTQNSVYLEEDKSYNQKRVMEFFRNWSPAALNPKNYQE